MIKKLYRNYKYIIKLENLLWAWQKFLRGKCDKKDVILFQLKLMDNLYGLQEELANKTYIHGAYKKFNISDPKPRIIHKAMVRDRLLHHLLYQELYPYFDSKFIFDSYSCRLRKGTHKALYRFRNLARKVSKNNSRTCWVLKCDIKKFFASVDHKILVTILEGHISDKDILWLLSQVIKSFHSEGKQGIGLPLGNLTSQLLVNIYMNEFDRFVKNELRTKFYVRYADDFLFLSNDKNYLENLLPLIKIFLFENLRLSLHPHKVEIKTLASGVDFLGWVNFPHHTILRTSTRRRMLKNISPNISSSTLASYIGMLNHGNSFNLKRQVEGKSQVCARVDKIVISL